MANIKINDVPQRIQYVVSSPTQSVFTIPFPFLANTDIVVWQDEVQLVQGGSPGQYTLTGAGTASGGAITLITAAITDAIITIVGDTPIDRTSIYSPTISNLTGDDLNSDLNRIIIMLQELWTNQNYLQLAYSPYAEVSQDLSVTRDRIIPILPPGYIWAMNDAGNAIIAVPLPTSGGGGTGTVTSVGLSTSTLALGGTNPVTTSGVITVNLPVIGGLTPGSYTNTNLTVDAYGRITTAANGSSGSNGSMVQTITQVTHGFTVNQIVYWTGSAYALALADTAVYAEVYGMVTTVLNANAFIVTLGGLIQSTGLSVGVNFLSDAVAGALTTTPPTTAGHIEKPLLIATTTTSGLFVNWRGKVIPDTTPLSGSWQTVATATAMVSGVNYIVNGGPVAFTLPVTATIGDTMEIACFTDSWTLAQNVGQSIMFGNIATTTGVAGSLASTNTGDCLRLVCTVTNTDWIVLSDMGNITYV